jgi:hypothetical protein
VSARGAVLLGLLLLPGGRIAAQADPVFSVGPAERPDVTLPITVDQVWYRAGGDRESGQLMVTSEGLEFTARERTVIIPLDRIHVLSYGKMKGDVDTDWVVMAVGVTPPLELVGLRDGRKLGFGSLTEELYDKLLAAARKVGFAQYRVAPGFEVYEDPGGECAVAIPEDWSAYVQSMVVVEDRAPWGTTILSSEPIRVAREEPGGPSRSVADPAALRRAIDGRAPAFSIERSEASRGMRCDGLSKRGRAEVLERAARDRLFGRGYQALQQPTASEARVADCAGLHVVGRSRAPDGVEMVLEQYVAADRGTLFTFGLRAPADRLEEFRGPFDAAVASAKLSVALP